MQNTLGLVAVACGAITALRRSPEPFETARQIMREQFGKERNDAEQRKQDGAN